VSTGGFEYFINQKRNVAVISFVGKADRSHIDHFAKCYDQVGALPCRFVVFNFTGVTGIAAELDPALVRLQVLVREAGREVSVCGLSSELKKRLTDSGIIRSYETYSSLVEALQKIVSSGGDK